MGIGMGMGMWNDSEVFLEARGWSSLPGHHVLLPCLLENESWELCLAIASVTGNHHEGICR
jgi:hypothetical protein